MPAPLKISMTEALHRLRNGTLPDNWMYLKSAAPSLDSEVVFLDDDDPDQANELGFPVEGLNRQLLEDVLRSARALRDPPSDALLLEAVVFYITYDGFLPYPGARPPFLR